MDMDDFDLLEYIDGDIYYECFVCRRKIPEDMLCCFSCQCNVCSDCNIHQEGDSFCSRECMHNFTDPMLHTCSVCFDQDVLSTQILVCLSCEKEVCKSCAVPHGLGALCTSDCGIDRFCSVRV